jgi:hypothetical protein
LVVATVTAIAGPNSLQYLAGVYATGGFLAAVVRKKLGLKLESEKADGERLAALSQFRRCRGWAGVPGNNSIHAGRVHHIQKSSQASCRLPISAARPQLKSP